jgi:hypothetical protein
MCILSTIQYLHINALYKYIHEAAITDRIIKSHHVLTGLSIILSAILTD